MQRPLKPRTTRSKYTVKPRSVFTTAQKREVAKISKQVEYKAAEHKQYANGQAYVSIYGASAGSNTTHLTTVSQGNSDSTRLGDELTLKAIHLRLNIFNGQNATCNPFNNTRVIIFQYKSPDNTPDVTKLLLNGGGTGTRNAFSSFDIDYKGTYVVLFDETYTTHSTNVANGTIPSDFSIFAKISVPLKYCKKRIVYQNGTTISNNGVWLTVIGDQPSIASNPAFQYDVNVTFSDS